MCLARLRRFAWMLALALLAGLAAPAFVPATKANARAAPAPVVHVHVHADGSVHSHAKPQASGHRAQASDPSGAQRPKAAHHCPGCLTAAECALACFGVGVLPASVLVPAKSFVQAWTASVIPAPAGFTPLSDQDPPRPVPVR